MLGGGVWALWAEDDWVPDVSLRLHELEAGAQIAPWGWAGLPAPPENLWTGISFNC